MRKLSLLSISTLHRRNGQLFHTGKGKGYIDRVTPTRPYEFFDVLGLVDVFKKKKRCFVPAIYTGIYQGYHNYLKVPDQSMQSLESMLSVLLKIWSPGKFTVTPKCVLKTLMNSSQTWTLMTCTYVLKITIKLSFKSVF